MQTKFSGVIIWSKLAICNLRNTKLGPDNNTYLDQIITPEKCFFCLKTVLKLPMFTVFSASTNIWPKMRPKTITFIFSQTQVIKKTFCCNAPLDQQLVFFFLKERTLMLNKRHSKKNLEKQRSKIGS